MLSICSLRGCVFMKGLLFLIIGVLIVFAAYTLLKKLKNRR